MCFTGTCPYEDFRGMCKAPNPRRDCPEFRDGEDESSEEFRARMERLCDYCQRQIEKAEREERAFKRAKEKASHGADLHFSRRNKAIDNTLSTSALNACIAGACASCF